MDYYYNIEDLLVGGLSAGIIFVLILILAALIIYIVGLWKVFEKAGKPGWSCLVPYYGNWVLTEIAGLHWMYFLFICSDSFVELLNLQQLGTVANLLTLYGSFMCAYNIAKKFNKGVGYSICLFFFGIIVYPILGFSKNNQYDSSIAVSEHGVFGNSSSTNNNNNYQYQNNNNYNNVNNMHVNDVDNNVSNNLNTNNLHSFCSNCGMKLDTDIRFCPNCGKEIIK